jgi:hypothetical protein
LSYGWLRESAVKSVKISGFLKELNDFIVMIHGKGLQKKLDAAREMENDGCDAETYGSSSN